MRLGEEEKMGQGDAWNSWKSSIMHAKSLSSPLFFSQVSSDFESVAGTFPFIPGLVHKILIKHFEAVKFRPQRPSDVMKD